MSRRPFKSGQRHPALLIRIPRCLRSSPALKQKLIHRNQSRPHSSQRTTSRSQRQRKLIIIDRQISVRAVDLPNRHTHLERQQQRRRSRKQSEQQQPAPKSLNHPSNIEKISRQSVLHKKALHLRPAAQMRQFRIPVKEKNNSQSNAKHQQSHRSKRVQKSHAPLTLFLAPSRIGYNYPVAQNNQRMNPSSLFVSFVIAEARP